MRDANNGYYPVLSVAQSGDREVLDLSFGGGSGSEPSLGFLGIGGAGKIEFATDVKGAVTLGTPGFLGWTPLLEKVPDGSRRVFRVVDWQGGEGVKPATGLYVGSSGLVADIEAASDARGVTNGLSDVTGPASIDGDYLPFFLDLLGERIDGVSGAGLSTLISLGELIDIINSRNLSDIAAAVAANSLKVSNATHTGDVEGSSVLTIKEGAVQTEHIAAVTVSGSALNARVTVNEKGQILDYSTPTELDPGLIFAFAGSTIPSGWLVCDGSAVSRSTYADLFAVVGTIYGAGNGTTTFNLPDLSGRVVESVGTSTLSTTKGSATHTLTIAEIPPHSHPYNIWGEAPANGTGNGLVLFRQYAGSVTGVTGGGQAHNNVQPTIILNYIIKT